MPEISWEVRPSESVEGLTCREYTGTPAGVGPIQPGDTVEVEVEGIGTLSNPVVAG